MPDKLLDGFIIGGLRFILALNELDDGFVIGGLRFVLVPNELDGDAVALVSG